MATVALKISFEKPTFLKGFTREFIRSYVNEINTVVPENAPRLEKEFTRIYSKTDGGLKDRRLPPQFTGATQNSIGYKFSPLKPLSEKPQSLLTVGHQPTRFRGRMKTYVPAIEAGWGTVGSLTRTSTRTKPLERGKDGRKSKSASEKLSSDPRKLKSLRNKYFPDLTKTNALGNEVRKKVRVKFPRSNFYAGGKYNKSKQGPNVTPRNQSAERRTAFDRRIEEYGKRKLGIPDDGSRVSKSRMFLLKRSILAGAPGRDILPKYAKSPAVDRIWSKINTDVARNLTKKFTGTPKKEIYTRNFVYRGT